MSDRAPAGDSHAMEPITSIPLSDLCAVTLHRTLRIPDDGGEYPLPPSLGAMTAHSVAADELVVPVHRAEALWLEFSAPWWKPHALKVSTGRIDAISGETFDPESLTGTPQDYLVLPEQPWLDGINAGDGFIRQFVAVPLGEGLTVEAQLDGGEEFGGLTLSLFEPRPGLFPDEPPESEFDPGGMTVMACSAPLGLGAGGRMRQEIYADEHGVDTWQPKPVATVMIDLVDAVAFEVVTGRAAPPKVCDAATYTEHGLPWFDFLRPAGSDIGAAQRLAAVRSVADLEGRREEPLPIPEAQVRRLLRLRDLAGPRG